MKKSNIIKTKAVATLLAAITMFSAPAMNLTRVSASEINPAEVIETIIDNEETISDIKETFDDIGDAAKNLLGRITDKDLEKLKSVGIQTLVAALGEFVPGGKTMGPAVQALLGTAFLDKQLSLDDINDNINNLYSRIDQFENDMKDELKNIISIENFDYSIFTPYNSEIQGIINAIKAAQDSTEYTTKQKLAIIAAQIDADIEWKKGNSPFVGFTSVTKKLNTANLVGGNDMFTVVYNYYKQRTMFSGEAIDMARAVLDDIMQNYMAGYTVLLECLTAQLMVNALENTDGIDPYYLSHISTNTNEILAKINELNSVVMGTITDEYLDRTGTVSEKYNKILSTDRQLFVNKNKSDIQLTGWVDVTAHDYLWSKDEDMAVGSFNSVVMGGKHLSGDQIKDLANYAKGKGMTIRELLNANGIYTGNIPQNTYLATSNAYDDLGAIDFITGIVGSVHLHGLYKGINIDEKNPAEKEVRMWNHGCNGYLSSTWNFAEPGNAATIEIR